MTIKYSSLQLKRPATSDPLNKLDDPISETDIISATKKLKTQKAPGLNRIRNEMLKCGIHYLASHYPFFLTLS